MSYKNTHYIKSWYEKINFLNCIKNWSNISLYFFCTWKCQLDSIRKTKKDIEIEWYKNFSEEENDTRRQYECEHYENLSED